MVRMVGAVIGSYVLMFVLVFCVLTGLYTALGPDGAFQAGTYHLSTTWLIAATVLGFLAALIAGFVSSLIAPGTKAPVALAVVVVALGLLFAIPVLKDARLDPELRPANVAMMEAMAKAKQPTAAALGSPFLAAVAVLIGGRLRGSGAGR